MSSRADLLAAIPPRHEFKQFILRHNRDGQGRRNLRTQPYRYLMRPHFTQRLLADAPPVNVDAAHAIQLIGDLLRRHRAEEFAG